MFINFFAHLYFSYIQTLLLGYFPSSLSIYFIQVSKDVLMVNSVFVYQKMTDSVFIHERLSF